MQIRMTQNSTYQQIRENLNARFAAMARAQEQIASGRRLHRPSDDPSATAQVLGLESHLGVISGRRDAIQSARPLLESAASGLQQATDLISEGRAAMLSAMNGTLTEEGRHALANQLEGIREALLAVANTRLGDRFVFGGSENGREPFAEVTENGRTRIVYQGSPESISLSIGNGQKIEASVLGDEIFGRSNPSGVSFSGLTGVAAGLGPADGSGYATLHVRHDGTSGALGAGLAFVAGGAQDTLLGDRLLTLDATAGTVQLGTGPARNLPPPTSAEYSDFRVVDVDGSELHLDLSGYTGVDFSGTVTGAGSISMDGVNYQPLDYVDADLELTDGEGRRLHVDTRGISRAGAELVTFGGTASVFDVFAGAAEDLRNGDGLDLAGQVQRLNTRFGDLDLAASDVVLSLGDLGGRVNRLDVAEARLADVDLNLRGVLSDVQDADIVDAVTQLSQAEQSLQVAQAASARLIQQSLLNYL